MSEVKKTKVAGKRSAPEVVQVAAPTRVRRARKNGPIGSQTDSQGNNNAEPKKHPPTRGY